MTRRTESLIDPLRGRSIELCHDLVEHTQTLRDYATTPGNVWLAKGQLQVMTQLLSELDMLLEEIKRADDANV